MVSIEVKRSLVLRETEYRNKTFCNNPDVKQTIDQLLMSSQHSNMVAGVYGVMADISKITMTKSMVPNFVMKVDHTL